MRIALGIAYDGTRFEGWQSQPSGNTVQDHVEAALGQIAGQPVRVTAAGRTDTGVHATAQVVHFDTDAARPDSAWVRGTNAVLPESIAIQWAVVVDENFHARFSAISRTYRYLLYNHAVRPAVLARRCGWFHAPLDLTLMQHAAKLLIGEHDFSAFRSSQCQAKTPVRTMHRVEVTRQGAYFVCTFTANAFLHHMVRNLVGCLVYVGKGKFQPEWMGSVLAGQDRGMCAPTFAPDGLYLSDVNYGAGIVLPAFDPAIPLFPPK
jgi:tRNA pseudouridine38-40 synthase